MRRSPKRQGGLRGKVAVSNIKSLDSAKGQGASPKLNRNSPGYGKSLPTHAVVFPGRSTALFAVKR